MIRVICCGSRLGAFLAASELQNVSHWPGSSKKSDLFTAREILAPWEKAKYSLFEMRDVNVTVLIPPRNLQQAVYIWPRLTWLATLLTSAENASWNFW